MELLGKSLVGEILGRKFNRRKEMNNNLIQIQPY